MYEKFGYDWLSHWEVMRGTEKRTLVYYYIDVILIIFRSQNHLHKCRNLFEVSKLTGMNFKLCPSLNSSGLYAANVMRKVNVEELTKSFQCFFSDV